MCELPNRVGFLSTSCPAYYFFIDYFPLTRGPEELNLCCKKRKQVAIMLHPSDWASPGRTDQSWNAEYKLEILIYACDPPEHLAITTNLTISGYQCVHSYKKSHGWGGLFLSQHEEPGHAQVARCSRELSQGQESLQQGTWCPCCTSEVTTIQTQAQERLSAHIHDRRHQSPLMKDDAAARKCLDHLCCMSWLPWSEPGVATPYQGLSTLQTSIDSAVFPINHLAACSFPIQARDHRLLSAIMTLGLCCFTYRWTWPGPSPLRQIHVVHRTKRASKRLSETHPVPCWALLFNRVITTQDESVNGHVATFKKNYSAWKKEIAICWATDAITTLKTSQGRN